MFVLHHVLKKLRTLFRSQKFRKQTFRKDEVGSREPHTQLQRMEVSVEKLVLIRQHLNGWYSPKSYYFAKTVADVSFQTAVHVAPVTGIVVLLFSGFVMYFGAILKYMQWLYDTAGKPQSSP